MKTVGAKTKEIETRKKKKMKKEKVKDIKPTYSDKEKENVKKSK